MPSEAHDDLVRRCARLAIRKGFAFVLVEPYSRSIEFPDVIAWSHRGWSVLYECKVSRSDFLADRKKSPRDPIASEFLALGQERWYAAMPGVVKSVDELPTGWGLLELRKSRMCCVRPAIRNPELNHEILAREFSVLVPALRKSHEGYGNAPWLKFRQPKPQEVPRCLNDLSAPAASAEELLLSPTFGGGSSLQLQRAAAAALCQPSRTGQ